MLRKNTIISEGVSGYGLLQYIIKSTYREIPLCTVIYRGCQLFTETCLHVSVVPGDER